MPLYACIHTRTRHNKTTHICMYKHIIHNIFPVIIDLKLRATVNCNLEYHHRYTIFRRITLHHIWPCNFYLLILLRHSFLKPPANLYTARRLPHVARNTISVHNRKTMAIQAFYESMLTYIAYAWQLFLMARPTAVVGLSHRPRCGLVWSPNIGYRPSNCHASPAASTATDTCDVHSVMQPSLHMF